MPFSNAEYLAKVRGDHGALVRQRRERSQAYELLQGSPEGRALLAEVLEPFAAALEKFKTSWKPKPPKGVRLVLEKLEPSVVALRVLQSVLATLVLRRENSRAQPKRTLLAASRLVGRDLGRELLLDLAARSKEHGRDLAYFADIVNRRQRSPERVGRHLLEEVARYQAGGWQPEGLVEDNEHAEVGAWFILALDRVTGLFQVVNVKVGAYSRSVLEFSEDAHSWLSRVRSLAWAVEPFHVPSLVKPQLRDSFETGGNPDRPSPLMTLRAGADAETYHRIYSRGGLYPAQRACERLEVIPFRVNELVLAEAQEHWARDSSPMFPGCEIVPEPMYDKDHPDQAVRREQWRARLRAQGDNCGATDRRLGIARTLSIAECSKGRDLYFPHHVDFRGRMYPVPNWLQPQGRDLARALLDFSDAEPVSEGSEAAGWFWYAGAQLLLGSEALKEFSSFEAAGDAARAGFPEHDARPELADKPWQFRRWQREAETLRSEGQARLASWVQFDAHASAFQWLAMATGSSRLAELTGLTSEGPADLYSAFAALAARELPRMEAKDPQDAEDLAELLTWLGGIPRDFAKSVLMRRALGSAFFPIVNEIHGLIAEKARGVVAPVRDLDRAGSLLGSRLYELSKTFLPELERVRAWTDGIFAHARSELAKDEPVRWALPDGFEVRPAYGAWESRVIPLRSGGYARSLTVGAASGSEIDRRKERAAFLPNWIHSWDAYLVREVSRRFSGPLVTIHDCLATTPARAAELRAEIFSAFREAWDLIGNPGPVEWGDLRDSQAQPSPTPSPYAFT